LKIIKQSVELLQISKDPLKLIEKAGRVCYKSEDKITAESSTRFVKMIQARGHESVLEHAFATFRIVTDRGISHEIVRHRLASYSQESTRYCNYSKDKFGKEITVIEPPGLTLLQARVWRNGCEHAEVTYFGLLDEGCKPEIARSVLPTCLKTEIVMTANFREWKHFLALRTAETAHPQIREIALAVKKYINLV